ncbi:GIY-YIG nuclease family protein [Paenibacillus nasutitermitis]|uniref:GIY-YIG nuclease family protein n=1 Tax=Paenibacillus nasutitermitis TaxID=1652958 RepID=A0A916YI53_9BACL|nr:GIY-YIG nuclease family protein [Paenibacillus nasutitermitis]GGD46755.1 hypothetical protein GCM10010911_00310 [Paenibacillus nasutitermitis]
MDRRKELQNEFASRKRAMGVFQIRNLANGKRYIATTSTLDSAWQRELFILNMGSHRNSQLQADWKRDGGKQFEFEVLESLKLGDEVRNDYKDITVPGGGVQRNVVMGYRDALKKLEQKWLDRLQPYDSQGYHKQPKKDD